MRDTARESTGDKNKRRKRRRRRRKRFPSVHSIPFPKIECTVSLLGYALLFRSMEIQKLDGTSSRRGWWNFIDGKLHRLPSRKGWKEWYRCEWILSVNSREGGAYAPAYFFRLVTFRDRCSKRAIFQRLGNRKRHENARNHDERERRGRIARASFFFFSHRGEERSRRSQDGVVRATERKEDLSPFDF